MVSPFVICSRLLRLRRFTVLEGVSIACICWAVVAGGCCGTVALLGGRRRRGSCSSRPGFCPYSAPQTNRYEQQNHAKCSASQNFHDLWEAFLNYFHPAHPIQRLCDCDVQNTQTPEDTENDHWQIARFMIHSKHAAFNAARNGASRPEQWQSIELFRIAPFIVTPVRYRCLWVVS